eukprot:CAMPEP_0181497590 /NCGR_PEP_ID=MMETSP1110-20121109/53617_1 /TAXON_ID=174948 /ORGANISM="Symbiodinium sp., Strain CCMP421" /LENGTH=133 /DNA_ID=CAMNT_0023625541 /DNA_START=11 /DNA_END=409 /DNA_ORIENTATION=+
MNQPQVLSLTDSSRIPSVSRAISAICQRRPEQPLQVEFVGGRSRWRFVEEAPLRNERVKASSQPSLHHVTIAGGWGERSDRERRLAKLASKLGYYPGLPRQKVESRLDSFLPAEFRAGAFSNFTPKKPRRGAS